jgi:hypothetical protein
LSYALDRRPQRRTFSPDFGSTIFHPADDPLSQTKATLKTRKSLGGSGKRGCGCGDDSGDNEDFMPRQKKAAAAKALNPIVPAGAASRARPKAKAYNDELDDDKKPPPAKKRAAPATKKVLQPLKKDESDLDNEPPPPKKAQL